ncbi:glycosyltransferase, partial [Escherichia coli]|uniref:glycosyltransferase family 2 protein n=1 Tax=Escherichia coli TaxID=562 RepID=UPI0021587DA0
MSERLMSQARLSERVDPSSQDQIASVATTVGVVVIGRNEGARLIACLESLNASGCPIVYVDSGSVDGSQEAAVRLGAKLVALDVSRPFSAARARNEGFAELVGPASSLSYV